MARIYVASLKDYNAGTLHGAWIDLDGKDKDDVMGEVSAMLAASPSGNAEEWEIHDSEDFCIDIKSYDIDELIEIAALQDQHDPDILQTALDCASPSDAEDWINENYIGHYSSKEDFAEEFITELYDMDKLPDIIRNNIDWDSIGDELEHDHIFVDAASGIHVFRNA